MPKPSFFNQVVKNIRNVTLVSYFFDSSPKNYCNKLAEPF